MARPTSDDALETSTNGSVQGLKDRTAPAAGALEAGQTPADRGVHEHPRDLRDGSALRRQQTSLWRVEAAVDRDTVAHARDQAASARDQASALLDDELGVRAAAREVDGHPVSAVELPARAAENRKRAQAEHAAAAEGRLRAAADRRQAAFDREQAALDRLQAQADREALLDQLAVARAGDLALERAAGSVER